MTETSELTKEEISCDYETNNTAYGKLLIAVIEWYRKEYCKQHTFAECLDHMDEQEVSSLHQMLDDYELGLYTRDRFFDELIIYIGGLPIVYTDMLFSLHMLSLSNDTLGLPNDDLFKID